MNNDQKSYKLSNQALGAVMMALQESLLNELDIVPILKSFELVATDDGLKVSNPPTVRFSNNKEISESDLLKTRKREHSRKPDEQYKIIESCSWGPFLELFGRGKREGWTVWGNQADDDYKPTWKTYAYNSSVTAAE